MAFFLFLFFTTFKSVSNFFVLFLSYYSFHSEVVVFKHLSAGLVYSIHPLLYFFASCIILTPLHYPSSCSSSLKFSLTSTILHFLFPFPIFLFLYSHQQIILILYLPPSLFFLSLSLFILPLPPPLLPSSLPPSHPSHYINRLLRVCDFSCSSFY